MIRYTTPTITLTVNADLTGTDVYVNIAQGRKEIVKKNPGMTVSEGETTLTVPLTQEETAAFSDSSPVEIQVNFISGGGIRNATTIATVQTFRNLLDEVVEYGD